MLRQRTRLSTMLQAGFGSMGKKIRLMPMRSDARGWHGGRQHVQPTATRRARDISSQGTSRGRGSKRSSLPYVVPMTPINLDLGGDSGCHSGGGGDCGDWRMRLLNNRHCRDTVVRDACRLFRGQPWCFSWLRGWVEYGLENKRMTISSFFWLHLSHHLADTLQDGQRGLGDSSNVSRRSWTCLASSMMPSE